ncbi:MAG: baseplate J/gp47 family protein [Solirubrobacteraceae bacterium]|jgi:uncharacterized phage protein gp47/JayE
MSTSAPASQAHDRLQFLLSADNTAWNGIDYVEVVGTAQTQLYVHFLTTVAVAPSAGAAPPTVTITGGETITSVAVVPGSLSWSADSDGRPLLGLAAASAGDFSTYTLTIAGSPALDPFFDAVSFSFKANCPTDHDPGATTPAPSAPSGEAVAIDYLAKDFAGFTQALSDFSALRYPSWVERSGADVGVMLIEALSAIADELSYYQDRVAAEASITTATQRVSLVRHARLVDYEPAAASAATTILQLDVGSATPVPAGLVCSAPGADGVAIPFEIGEGLTGAAAATYPVNPLWNASTGTAFTLVPYWWDDSLQILSAGSATLWLVGTGHQLGAGQQLLIDTAGATSADPPIRELVTIASAPLETEDPVFSTPVTRLTLSAPTALAHDLSLTHLAGNLVPAVQGQRAVETFVIPQPSTSPTPAPAAGLPAPAPAVVRAGANWTPENPSSVYLNTLGAPQISWLPVAAADADTSASVTLAPQIMLGAALPDGGSETWQWQRWLLDSAPQDAVFTLTPERYSPVGAADGVTWFDYDGEGTTIRFGDGTFGRLPEPGTVFTVTYLAGGGAVGNVPADTIVTLRSAPGGGAGPAAQINACTNPFPATGGADEETARQVVDRAPQAFRANPLRVVQPRDYVAAAQSEDWVQQAGSSFRWTGSWLTVLTAANPVGAEVPTAAQVEALSDLLNRRRLAGYESYVLTPQYVSVDLVITVAAAVSDFAADVAATVLAQLSPGTLPGGATGFFDHSRWSFGQALEPSALLAAAQGAPGVVGVVGVQYRHRGSQPRWTALSGPVAVAPDRILRVDNDPSRPEAGSLRVIVQGGK